jgi:hypothetical protein
LPASRPNSRPGHTALYATESVARLTFTRAAARANLAAMDRLDELENELLNLQADADWVMWHVAAEAELSEVLNLWAVLETCRRELRRAKELAAFAAH